MHIKRTRGWYVTRFALALGIAVVFGVFLVLAFPPSFVGGDGGSPSESPLLSVVEVAAFLAMFVGLGWMIRILRGPRIDPPSWRYRDR
jgi:hypothetical protein